MNAFALAAGHETGLLAPIPLDLDDPREGEVIVRVFHCGLCRSDLGRIESRFVAKNGPVIPGHEVIGEIVQVGRGVPNSRLGTRVGVGWQSASCGKCEWCLAEEEHLCGAQEETCVERPGGFATHVRVQSRFAVALPDRLDSAHAAPLLCAGITVYSPMARRNLHAGMRAAVIGVGGLGHLALQFLRAFGCEADAFSTTNSKEADAKRFGAAGFFSLRDELAARRIRSTYDFMICASPAVNELNGLIRMLRPRGILCLTGLPKTPATFDVERLIGYQKSIEGSPIGSPGRIAEMLRFAAERDVQPVVEMFPMTEANRALEKLGKNQVRYRAVLSQNLI
ncbi:MAG TPA: NAD(P)-dependent alcohol dehydrogenase [Terriglobia bacterium]|nr:NAD(P)-dependent alcohol dehydrogenase [Terriglobia bacterium]